MKLLILLPLIPGLLGCASPGPSPAAGRPGATAPARALQIESVQAAPEALGLDVQDLALTLHLVGPARGPLQIGGIAHRLRSGGRVLVEGRASLDDVLAAGARARLRHVLTVPTAIVLGALPGVAPGSVVPYEVEVFVLDERGAILASSIARGEIALPAGLGVLGIAFPPTGGIALRVQNANHFELLVDSLVLAGSVGGQAVDLQALDAGLGLPPGGEAILQLAAPPAPPGPFRLQGTAIVFTSYGQILLPVFGTGESEALGASPPGQGAGHLLP